jgi:Domain of unknown function (DUF1905)
MASYEVTRKVWLYPGKGGWHFVALPSDLVDDLRVRYADAHRPFGSLQVTASLGSSTWSTSLFTDIRTESYLLPINAEVRRREQIEDGDTATVRIELDD